MCTHGKLYRNVGKTPCLSFIFLTLFYKGIRNIFRAKLNLIIQSFKNQKQQAQFVLRWNYVLMSSINGNSFGIVATTTTQKRFILINKKNIFGCFNILRLTVTFNPQTFEDILFLLSVEVVFNIFEPTEKN